MSLSIAGNGDKVLTERIDKFDMPGGKRVEPPVTGTCVITDSKISLWRDYFNLASLTVSDGLTAQMGMGPACSDAQNFCRFRI